MSTYHSALPVAVAEPSVEASADKRAVEEPSVEASADAAAVAEPSAEDWADAASVAACAHMQATGVRRQLQQTRV